MYAVVFYSYIDYPLGYNPNHCSDHHSITSCCCVFSTCGLQTEHVDLCLRSVTDPGCNMRCVLRLSPASSAFLLYPAEDLWLGSCFTG